MQGKGEKGIERVMKDKAWPKTETDLARPVVAWLREMGWEVYQEVQVHSYGRIADIVATRGPVVWVIECKRRLGLVVVGQAEFWKHLANRVSVATASHPDTLMRQFLRVVGVGALTVTQTSEYDDGPDRHLTRRNVFEIEETVLSPIWRKAKAKSIRSALTEAHKTYAEAGNNLGRRYSPFKGTCASVRRAVKEHPGITMKELIDRVIHHYGNAATARGCIAGWAKLGKIEGVRVEYEGRKIRLFPTDTERARAGLNGLGVRT